jgi:predicted phage terminase large subunit-like protein
MELTKEKKILILKQAFSQDIESFGKYFFPQHLKNNTPPFHREIYSLLESNLERIGIAAPRGHAKSTVTDLVFLIWNIVNEKAKFILLVSDTYSQAVLFMETLKAELESNEKLKAFYGNLVSKNWSEGEIITNRIMVKALGAGMKVRGLKFRESRPDLIVVDDLENDELVENKDRREKLERWFNGALIPSLAKFGRVVVIGTILHFDSLLAKIVSLDKYTEYTKKIYRAIKEDGHSLWPEHLNLEELEKIKQEYINKKQVSLFYSEYMNNPVDKENQEFKVIWFKYRKWEELVKLNCRKFLTIDTAISKEVYADYTAFCKNYVDPQGFWNLRTEHARLNPKELIDKLFYLQEQENFEAIGIEKTIYLDTIKPFLDEEMRKRGKFLPIVQLEHKQQAKELRIRSLIPLYSSGSVFHIEDQCKDLEDELLTFPKGIHDDVVDATAYQVQIAKKPYEQNYRLVSPMSVPSFK